MKEKTKQYLLFPIRIVGIVIMIASLPLLIPSALICGCGYKLFAIDSSMDSVGIIPWRKRKN